MGNVSLPSKFQVRVPRVTLAALLTHPHAVPSPVLSIPANRSSMRLLLSPHCSGQAPITPCWDQCSRPSGFPFPGHLPFRSILQTSPRSHSTALIEECCFPAGSLFVSSPCPRFHFQTLFVRHKAVQELTLPGLSDSLSPPPTHLLPSLHLNRHVCSQPNVPSSFLLPHVASFASKTIPAPDITANCSTSHNLPESSR